MARFRTLPFLALATTGLMAWADSGQPLPTPFPEARYQKMSAKSPFAIASATAAATAAPTPGFAAQLYVDGVAHIGDHDFVAIKSRDPDKPAVLFLQVGTPSDDGLKAESINWSPEMGKSTVEVSKGGEKATLEFDEATIAKAAAPATSPAGVRLPPLPGQGRPNYPPGYNRFFPQQPGNPGIVLPPGMNSRRRMRGLIEAAP